MPDLGDGPIIMLRDVVLAMVSVLAFELGSMAGIHHLSRHTTVSPQHISRMCTLLVGQYSWVGVVDGGGRGWSSSNTRMLRGPRICCVRLDHCALITVPDGTLVTR